LRSAVPVGRVCAPEARAYARVNARMRACAREVASWRGLMRN